MDEHGMTPLMAETLQEGLSRLYNRPVIVQEIRRDLSPKSSSFWTERLGVRLDRGESLPVFFKDLNPRHQVNAAPALRAREAAPSRRELQMYQQVLSRERFGTPELYAFRWDPQAGVYWLFLENVGEFRLSRMREFEYWLAGVEWAARFHAALRPLRAAQAGFLPRYDEAHYRGCAEQVESKLPGLAEADRGVIGRALGRYLSVMDRFTALPQGVIHGELFAKNVVVRTGSPAQKLGVVDWESAAIGPSYLDLVSLSAGRWSAEQRRAMWHAYFDRYQADTGLRLDWEDFCRDLGLLSLYQALRWLGWWPGRHFSHHFGRWVEELETVLADYFPGV
jgi:aminoglycoside/choline kinase family phosphotransferase